MAGDWKDALLGGVTGAVQGYMLNKQQDLLGGSTPSDEEQMMCLSAGGQMIGGQCMRDGQPYPPQLPAGRSFSAAYETPNFKNIFAPPKGRGRASSGVLAQGRKGLQRRK